MATPLLIITGMHRSGTSALCAALQACGVSFGEHLLAPMAGVNDEGFWEDREVVELNEQLLAKAGSYWYDITLGEREIDWYSSDLNDLAAKASAILQRGFGAASVQAVKDPRFCITLPLWLRACEQLGITSHVCVIDREPLEVAASLQKRDAFPLGVGLRLYLAYWQQITRHLPDKKLHLRFDELLADPITALSAWQQLLPLTLSPEAIKEAVRHDLRHQQAVAGGGSRDLDALRSLIEREYPLPQTVNSSVQQLVLRGEKLTDVGGQHEQALNTIVERDAQIEQLAVEYREAIATVEQRDNDIASLDQRIEKAGHELEHAMGIVQERDAQLQAAHSELATAHTKMDEIGEQHSYALSVIEERDAQIRDFDQRLGQLGDEHSHALDVLRQRDATIEQQQHALDDMELRLQRLLNLPALGPVIRKLWFYEKR